MIRATAARSVSASIRSVGSIDPLGELVVLVLEQMAVAVERRRDRSMAKVALDRLRVRTLGEQLGDGRVDLLARRRAGGAHGDASLAGSGRAAPERPPFDRRRGWRWWLTSGWGDG